MPLPARGVHRHRLPTLGQWHRVRGSVDRNRGHRRSARRCSSWCSAWSDPVAAGSASTRPPAQTLPHRSTVPAGTPPLRASRSHNRQHLRPPHRRLEAPPERLDTSGLPAVGDDATIPRDAPKRPIADVQLPEPPAEPAAPEVGRRRQQRQAPELGGRRAAAPDIDAIAPAEGRLERLRGRLAKSQNALGRSMLGLLGGGDLDEDSWEAVEDTLLVADLGSVVTDSVVDRAARTAGQRPGTHRGRRPRRAARGAGRRTASGSGPLGQGAAARRPPVGAAGRRGQRHRQDHHGRQAGPRARRRRAPGGARRRRHLPGRRGRPAAGLGVAGRRAGGARRRGRRPRVGGVRRRRQGHRRPAPTSSSSTPRAGCTPRPG